MLANKEYWQSVYSTSKVPTFPSQFSVFVQSWLNNNDANIIEVGCGNGRDSRFFHQMGHSVTVSDQVICEDLQRFAMSRHNVAAVETSIVDAVES
ncbi:MAG: 2-polyprenyl-3-methyl-5-hydroxy-6-metoxy-1,4-benzoquinol methylase, partial [Pseudomonadales bacterium]